MKFSWAGMPGAITERFSLLDLRAPRDAMGPSPVAGTLYAGLDLWLTLLEVNLVWRPSTFCELTATSNVRITGTPSPTSINSTIVLSISVGLPPPHPPELQYDRTSPPHRSPCCLRQDHTPVQRCWAPEGNLQGYGDYTGYGRHRRHRRTCSCTDEGPISTVPYYEVYVGRRSGPRGEMNGSYPRRQENSEAL